MTNVLYPYGQSTLNSGGSNFKPLIFSRAQELYVMF